MGQSARGHRPDTAGSPGAARPAAGRRRPGDQAARRRRVDGRDRLRGRDLEADPLPPLRGQGRAPPRARRSLRRGAARRASRRSRRRRPSCEHRRRHRRLPGVHRARARGVPLRARRRRQPRTSAIVDEFRRRLAVDCAFATAERLRRARARPGDRRAVGVRRRRDGAVGRDLVARDSRASARAARRAPDERPLGRLCRAAHTGRRLGRSAWQPVDSVSRTCYER